MLYRRQCENDSHRDELGIFFTKSWWVLCLRQAINLNTSVVALVPSQAGMNMTVYDSHKASRDSFMIWRGIGKPRQGYEFDMMRFSRAQFKYALRSAKQ